jgi:hypothetical protein
MATTGTTAGNTGLGGAGLNTTSGTGSVGAGTYGRVILTIKSAHNMNDKAFIGKSDPYCVVKVSDAEIQTAHVKNAGEHCVWDESFAFNNVAPTDVIEFKVYDHNRLIKDAFMGEGSISLRQVFEEGRLETRVPLASRTGVKDAGEVWISLRKEEGGAQGAGTAQTAGLTSGAAGAATGYGAGQAGYARDTGVSETGKYEGERAGIGGVGGVTSTEREAGYGERERYESGTAAVPASAVGTGAGYGTGEREYTTGVERGAYTGTERGLEGGEVRQGEAAVCGQEYFTKTEDRPIVKERVTYIKEHRPVEKEFVVETRATGQERQATGHGQQESLGTQTKVVSEAQPRSPCE